MGWTVRGSNPGKGEIFRIGPDRSWGSSTHTMGTGYFPGVKRPGRGVNHPPPSSAKVEERAELYLYSPSGSSWSVLGGNLVVTQPQTAGHSQTSNLANCQKRYLTLRLLMSYIYIYIYIYIYGAPIFDVSRSHTTTQHSR